MFSTVPTQHLCKVLDHLPPLPPALLNESTISKSEVIWPGGEITTTIKRIIVPAIKTQRIIVKSLLDEWVLANITKNPTSVLFRKVEVNEGSNFYLPHIDTSRQFTLIYNTQNSGGDVVYWKAKDKPIFFDGHKTPVFDDYDKLDEVYRMPTPIGKWYILNNTAIHSVEGMTSMRAGIQVSVTAEDPLVDCLVRL